MIVAQVHFLLVAPAVALREIDVPADPALARLGFEFRVRVEFDQRLRPRQRLQPENVLVFVAEREDFQIAQAFVAPHRVVAQARHATQHLAADFVDEQRQAS